MLVVTEHPDIVENDDGTVQHRLLLDQFFLLTKAPEEEVPAEEFLERYRGRGRAEKDFGDCHQALQTRLSSSPRTRARATLGGRRIRVHVADRHVLAWKCILDLLADTYPVRGSPTRPARPFPAA